MADGYVQVPVDSSGKKIDAASIDVGSNTVMRQRIALADNIGTATYATVMSSGPAGSEGGLVVRNIPSGVQSVLGQVSIAAGTALMGAVSLAAGTANIGFINNISATVVISGLMGLTAGTALIGAVSNAAGTALMGAVSLAAGTANIGFINNISATVTVAGTVSLGAGTALIGAVSNGAGTALMGAVSLAAGTANIGFINNISATVVVTGQIGLTAGSSNIGFINGISATISSIVLGKIAHDASVTVGDAPVQLGLRANGSAPAAVNAGDATFAWADLYGRAVIVQNHPSLAPSASHGPKCVTCSTSAAVALIAAPGASLSIYITGLECSNGSATLTRADAYEASATGTPICSMYLAASGGGFAKKYDPPVRISANTAVNVRVKPSVSQAIWNVHFFVGP